ncbi:MAG: class I SAM-dependent methyltransferase [Candidatus Paceibacterota bacterium]
MFYSSGMYRGLYHGIFSPPRKRGNDKGFKKARANRAFVEKYVTLPEDAEILDFGSADGTTLLEFKEAYPKWHAYGLEPGSNLASLNQHLLDGFYNTPNDIPKEQKFDLIMMTHVLEHLFSPIDVLMELATHLKQDGTLVLEVPDFNQYTGSLRTIHIAHLYHFTDKTIEKLAKKAGLEVALITQDRRALDNHGMRVMLKKAAPKKS